MYRVKMHRYGVLIQHDGHESSLGAKDAFKGIGVRFSSMHEAISYADTLAIHAIVYATGSGSVVYDNGRQPGTRDKRVDQNVF